VAALIPLEPVREVQRVPMVEQAALRDNRVPAVRPPEPAERIRTARLRALAQAHSPMAPWATEWARRAKGHWATFPRERLPVTCQREECREHLAELREQGPLPAVRPECHPAAGACQRRLPMVSAGAWVRRRPTVAFPPAALVERPRCPLTRCRTSSTRSARRLARLDRQLRFGDPMNGITTSAGDDVLSVSALSEPESTGVASIRSARNPRLETVQS
jgi:hypothetical protein